MSKLLLPSSLLLTLLSSLFLASCSQTDSQNLASIGEICDANTPCELDAFCQSTIGLCSDTGVCVQFPEACTEQFDPVCGCNSRTFSNSCKAAEAGISIFADGQCEDVGNVTGECSRDIDCPDNNFCNLEGTSCGRTGIGICQTIPDACTLEVNPACGCDGVTYSNPCQANAAGVSVEFNRPCF